MSYVKTVWKDLPDRTTPITAARLDNLETQYDVGMADFGVGVSVKAHGAVGDGAADDTVAIQAAITAASGKVVFLPPGSYKIAGNLNVPANTAVRGAAGSTTITQTAVNTIAMTVTSGCSVSGVNFVGRGASGYNATAETNEKLLHVLNAAGATVRDCKFTQIASAGIYVQGSTDVRLENLTVVGPGSPTIAAGDGICYGIYLDSSSRVTVTDCDISELCQGIIAALTVTDLIVSDCTIYNIRGQHGMYLQNGNGVLLSGINFFTIALNGVKVQLSASSTADSKGLTISNIVGRSVADTVVILEHTDAALAKKFVGVKITGIIGIDSLRTVYTKSIRGGIISDITSINSTREAITILDCWDLTISNLLANTVGRSGIRLGIVTNGTNERVTIQDCQIRNPGQANVAGTQYGVYISAGTADITIDGLIVTATNTFMVYGVFFEAGAQASFTLMNSDISGSTVDLPVSVRGLAEGMKRWHNNKLSGSIQNITGLTTTTAPAAGGAGALPATPLGYYVVTVAGVDRKVAYY